MCHNRGKFTFFEVKVKESPKVGKSKSREEAVIEKHRPFRFKTFSFGLTDFPIFGLKKPFTFHLFFLSLLKFCTMKKFYLPILFFVLLFLSSCVDIEEHYDIKPDGSCN